MNGIMSKVEDRQDYEIGGGAGIQADNIRVSDLPFMKNKMPSENNSAPSITNKEMSFDDRIQAAQDKYNRSGINPIYKLAIQGGLRGMSERGGGSTIANLAKAFEGPTDQLFKDLDAKRLMERDIEFKRAEVAEQRKRRLQEQGFELEKLLTKDMRNELRQDAINLAEGDPQGRSVDEILGILTQKKLQELSKFRKMADPRETEARSIETRILEYMSPSQGLGIGRQAAANVVKTEMEIEAGKYGNVPLNVNQTYIDTDDVMDSRADEQGNLYLKKEGGAAEYPDEFMYINPQDGKIYLKQGNIFKLQMFPTE